MTQRGGVDGGRDALPRSMQLVEPLRRR